ARCRLVRSSVQFETLATAAKSVCRLRLLDHLISTSKQGRRYRESKRLGSLEINDQIHLRRLLDRHVSRLFPPEDSATENTGLAPSRWKVRSVTDQGSVGVPSVNRRDGVISRLRCNMVTVSQEKSVTADQECVYPLLDHIRKGLVNLAQAARIHKY